MSAPVLQIILGSTRPGRKGDAVAEWVAEAATAHGGFEVELVDLAEVGLPLLDEPDHPRLGDYVHQHTKDWSATIARGDAFVFVIPEYNHSFNAATKNAIDFLHNEWKDKAVGIVSYGGVSAGTRSMTALRAGALPRCGWSSVSEAVNIPFFAQPSTTTACSTRARSPRARPRPCSTSSPATPTCCAPSAPPSPDPPSPNPPPRRGSG